MAIEALQVEKEAAYQKEQAFLEAKDDIEWYQRKMADLKVRLQDFEGFDQPMDTTGDKLPPCMPDMYLDENMIPQSMNDTAAMD